MVVGAIDIGTNSVRLLITQKDERTGKWRDIIRAVEITRLGEGVDRTRRIKPEAMERTLAVLAQYKDLMNSYGVEKSRAVSTSAMRDAENAPDFIKLVQDKIGLNIEVVSGIEEGRLTFAGATGQGSLVSKDQVVLVVDVGGGSTEYIFGKDGDVLGATSLDIGSVRLTELFIKNDPPLEPELIEARETIKEHAELIFRRIADENPTTLVAVAGTATQLSAVHYGVEPYDPEKIHGSKITLPELKVLTERLAALDTEGRKKIKGMHPKRADVIIAGALILEETLEELCFSEMTISERDILDGIIYSLDN